ncbi:dTDP-4-dehydrorhamnose reductase [Christiangramia aquimixticola]|uniref:dTDP-4-dehydrorhamnose reductase n=1 Tax=Christiangramia aquimixticola TaxID=1697558 RepID=UPI003AA7F524
MKKILVTGSNGQLGQCFRKYSSQYPEFEFLFCSSKELDITKEEVVRSYFEKQQIDICINTAAYTNVEQAENEKEKAFLVNAEAAGILAGTCKEYRTELVHISTDYVFDGRSKSSYSETDEVNPINVYGASKLKGEENIQKTLDKYFIFRTSWLYSEFGHNFFNTIRKKAKENAELNITTSQLGTPTNANDLAKYVLKLLKNGSKAYGLYHFSNLGEATWFDFAQEIILGIGKIDDVNLKKTGFYKTLAVRPENSVLSKEKVQNHFGPVPEWKESLNKLITELDKA